MPNETPDDVTRTIEAAKARHARSEAERKAGRGRVSWLALAAVVSCGIFLALIVLGIFRVTP